METPELFARELRAPEGPTVGPDGWILNVCSLDVPGVDWPTAPGDITATHPSRPLETRTVFNTSTTEVTGIPAALAFGPDEALYVCDEGRRAMLRVSNDGEIREFITDFQGSRINGPNDLSFDSEGNLYFTDPWGSSLEKPIGAVYGYCWETQELTQIHSGLAFPNGILVRDDRLLAAETLTNKIWMYEVDGAGSAVHPREFCTLPANDAAGISGPDGMAADEDGNIYVATVGVGRVYVYSNRGKLIDEIEVGGVRPTNVCFGGPNHDTLYITIDELGTIVTVVTGVNGYRLPFCPSSVKNHPWARMLPPGRGHR